MYLYVFYYKDDLKYEELPKKKPQKAAVSENQMQDQTSVKKNPSNCHSVNLTLFLLKNNSKN